MWVLKHRYWAAFLVVVLLLAVASLVGGIVGTIIYMLVGMSAVLEICSTLKRRRNKNKETRGE